MQIKDKWSIATAFEDLAGITYENGDAQRAAILFGAAEALHEESGLIVDYGFQEKDIAATHKELGEEAFTRLLEKGRAMTLEEAVEFAMQTSESRPSAQPQKEVLGGLTAREREAAVLIAQGKSNREIAEAMTVTVKTVEAYITRINRKLGFTSRVQIATWVMDNETS